MRRRDFVGAAAAAAIAPGSHALALFRESITPEVGGPLFNNVKARSVVDPLYAHGVVWLGSGAPIVLAALDWCELRNASYDRWRSVLARAAGTTAARVLVTCVHQHDAPYCDADAQRMFEAAHGVGRICDPAFELRAIERVAAALGEALKFPRRITHLGTGQARVDRVASNRRYLTADGKVSFGRTSATRDPRIREAAEGLIDPWVKVLSFWDGGHAVCGISCYATHPMSYYGQGDVSADFVGMARARLAASTPGVHQVYLTGCSGDTMAGKYNDGNPANRVQLADRLFQGMEAAWRRTVRRPLQRIGFRSAELRLAPRGGERFTRAAMRQRLEDASLPYLHRAEAALGLSWLDRVEAGRPIDVPAVDFGGAHLLLMPAETFVGYQLRAQKMRPDSFVITAGFGECAPGYIPTADAAREGYDDHYSWIAFPECEAPMLAAMRRALGS